MSTVLAARVEFKINLFLLFTVHFQQFLFRAPWKKTNVNLRRIAISDFLT